MNECKNDIDIWLRKQMKYDLHPWFATQSRIGNSNGFNKFKNKKSAPLSSTVVLRSLINKGCTHSFEINFINFDTYPKWISELWRHQIWLCPLFQWHQWDIFAEMESKSHQKRIYVYFSQNLKYVSSKFKHN